ncbi:Transcriptional regulator, TetR family [Nostocoides japonicum T1-X7]|uniref:Transcriptional regulator, TetR family n=1 Tax=Nostocoides japonicum T1-X7 TaxID=1194083 RepID=A0A077LXW2_9MICO|nr:TetR/AcrR family transcriptional regulator [Tetrasphaera japonica]CCH77722.1 Transcriptional regulator, TetR family [Tetrasphaera japonica T1-X7]
MTQLASPSPSVDRPDRFDRSRVDRFEVRRGELADAALETLGELGYARTSLREIAHKTEFSHGVLHYYFRDKNELITYCVRRSKEHCVTRYDEILASAASADDLAELFAEALTETMRVDTSTHRLWYDMRTQAMFEEGLRPTVVDIDRQLEAMISRVVNHYAVLRGRPLRVSQAMAYAVFDGLFETCLMRHIAGDECAAPRLRAESAQLLPMLVAD